MTESSRPSDQRGSTLVLLPGLHGTADLFYPLLPHLPADLPTRILEYPTDHCLTVEGHLARLEHALAAERDLVLFAESFSGPLAVAFAARHPARVRALILCGTFIAHPVPRLLCYLAPLPILARVPIPLFAIRLFLGGHGLSSELARNTRAAIRRARPHVLAHRVLQAGHLDARPALRRCRCPILCLAGRRDRLVGRRSVRRLRRVRPDLSVEWVDGPHLLLQTRPAQVAQSVSRFLQRQGLVPALPPV